MSRIIAILEDDNRRIEVMQNELAQQFPGVSCITFDNAPEMIEWLKHDHKKNALICLDHDLGPNRFKNGISFDPGTGRDVADFLETCEPACPIIIHTTNQFGGDGMRYALEDAGWHVKRIVPYDDLTWIKKEWIRIVAQSLIKAM